MKVSEDSMDFLTMEDNGIKILSDDEINDEDLYIYKKGA